MEITVIIKQKIEALPPVLNLVDCLIDLNVKVNLICTDIDKYNIERYSGKIRIEIIEFKDFGFRPFKVFSLISFRTNVHKYLKNIHVGKTIDSVVWLASAEAALGVGKKIRDYNYVFQSHELYDSRIQYKIQNKFYFQNSILNICPEPNRGAILRYWYALKETPFLLVNSPFLHPRCLQMKIENDENADVIKRLSDKKIVLYMGQVSPERDVIPFLKAMESIDDKFHLVVMGAYMPNQDYITFLKNNFTKITIINGLPSPTHLQVVSWAYIGVLSYSYTDLNNIFCAPNKIWEYSGFGIPMISNDVPGVSSFMTKYKSGIPVNSEGSIELIKNAFMEIDKNYEDYSKNAQLMYDDCKFGKQVSDILMEIENRL